MKYRALASFSLGGGKDVAPGDEFELDERKPEEARLAAGFLYRRWAEQVGAGPGVIVAREPVPMNREPQGE